MEVIWVGGQLVKGIWVNYRKGNFLEGVWKKGGLFVKDKWDGARFVEGKTCGTQFYKGK